MPSPRSSLSALGLLLSSLTLLGPILVSLAALQLLGLPATALAQRPAPTILPANDTKYRYAGCYNETSGLGAGTASPRALDNGIHEVGTGNMTVPICLNFCSSSGVVYKYAGIEFSRECWCSQSINGLSVKWPDSECDLGCDGDQTTACGGALKLTVYQLGAAPTVRVASAAAALVAVTALFNLI